MKKEIAKLLVEASDGNFELYENYSGRGMFGETTTGVVACDRKELMEAVAAVQNNLFVKALAADPKREIGLCFDLAAQQNDLNEFLARMQEDSLGRDVIFY